MNGFLERFDLVPAKPEDLQYFLSCVKADALSSVDDRARNLSSLWIDDALSLAKKHFVDKPMDDEIFILRNGGADAGMLWLGVSRDMYVLDPVGYIIGIFVEEKFRNRGVAKAMIEYAERWALGKGFVTLQLSVGEHNEAAKSLYDAMGFNVQTRVMTKDLR